MDYRQGTVHYYICLHQGSGIQLFMGDDPTFDAKHQRWESDRACPGYGGKERGQDTSLW